VLSIGNVQVHSKTCDVSVERIRCHLRVIESECDGGRMPSTSIYVDRNIADGWMSIPVKFSMTISFAYFQWLNCKKCGNAPPSLSLFPSHSLAFPFFPSPLLPRKRPMKKPARRWSGNRRRLAANTFLRSTPLA